MDQPELIPRHCRVFAEGPYRYLLDRAWSRGDRTLLWIMLNPSTADDEKDDPTIRRCIGFALNKYDHMVVVNLFALRSTDPDLLMQAADPVGLHNDRVIDSCLVRVQDVVVAWGAHPFAVHRAHDVLRRVAARHRRILCLGKTSTGMPRHPLYVRRSQPFELFVPE